MLSLKGFLTIRPQAQFHQSRKSFFVRYTSVENNAITQSAENAQPTKNKRIVVRSEMDSVYSLWQSGKHKEAFALVDNLAASGKALNSVGYTRLFAELKYVKDAQKYDQETAKYLEQMLTLELYPNRHIFNSIASNLCKMRAWDKLVKYTEMMQSLKVEKDTFTYNYLITMHAEKADAAGAIQAYNDLLKDDNVPNEYTFYVMMRTFVGAKDVKNLLKYYKIISAKVTPTPAVIGTVFESLHSVKDLNNMKYFFSEISKHKVQLINSSVYNQLIKVAIGQKDINTAIKAFHAILEWDLKPTMHTFGKFIEYYGTIGDIPQMLHWYQLMKQHGLKPDSITYGSLLSSYAKLKTDESVKEIIKIFTEMEKDKIPASAFTYGIVICALSRKLDLVNMQIVYDKLVEHHAPSEVVLSTMVDSFTRAGEITSAIKYLKKLVAARFKPKPATVKQIDERARELWGDDDKYKEWDAFYKTLEL